MVDGREMSVISLICPSVCVSIDDYICRVTAVKSLIIHLIIKSSCESYDTLKGNPAMPQWSWGILVLPACTVSGVARRQRQNISIGVALS